MIANGARRVAARRTAVSAPGTQHRPAPDGTGRDVPGTDGQEADQQGAHRTGGTPAVSVRALTKSYDRRRGGEPALRAVDLDVQPGEFLVLLGPSGCGKTTLLRSIAGLEDPEAGSISIDGTTVFDSATGVNVGVERRPVSMIFQSYALWPHMTAAQNVAFPLKCGGVPRRQRAAPVADILDRLGIGALADRYPSQMSGGQQQRLALARALVVGQRVVLFDEPLSNVDAQIRERLRLELIKMQRSLGFTAIYVTHDQAEAMELADRLAVMEAGRIVQLDEPRQMYRSPATVHVARFLGQSNEIALTVEHYDPATRLLRGDSALGPVQATWRPDDDQPPPEPETTVVAFGRPVHFRLLPAPPSDPPSAPPSAPDGAVDNQWAASIEAIRFLGDHAECLVRIGEVRLRCALPDDRTGEVAEGDPVQVHIPPARLLAMPVPGAAPAEPSA